MWTLAKGLGLSWGMGPRRIAKRIAWGAVQESGGGGGGGGGEGGGGGGSCGGRGAGDGGDDGAGSGMSMVPPPRGLDESFNVSDILLVVLQNKSDRINIGAVPMNWSLETAFIRPPTSVTLREREKECG